MNIREAIVQRRYGATGIRRTVWVPNTGIAETADGWQCVSVEKGVGLYSDMMVLTADDAVAEDWEVLP
jgi:hypothetical protein